MKNKKIQYLLNVTLLILFISGMQSCNQKPAAAYMNPAFKQYFDYKPGSYWVMYDSVTHHTDSFVVLSYSDRLPGVNTTDRQESIEIVINEYDKDSLADSVSWGLLLSQPYYSFLSSGVTATAPDCDYNFVKQVPFDTTSNVAHLPYYFSGVSYQDVYKINLGQAGDFFFINSEVGLIKILLDDQYYHRKLYLVRQIIIH